MSVMHIAARIDISADVVDVNFGRGNNPLGVYRLNFVDGPFPVRCRWWTIVTLPLCSVVTLTGLDAQPARSAAVKKLILKFRRIFIFRTWLRLTVAKNVPLELSRI